MGANIFAQNYGPAFRSMVGGDPLKPGGVENFVRESITPEEQLSLEENPLREILKSSVGMASIFSPVNATNIARTAGVNALKGGMWGLGTSDKGNELEDIVYGGLVGGLMGGAGAGVKKAFGSNNLQGKWAYSPESYDEVLDIGMPMQRDAGFAGYRPNLENVVNRYANGPVSTYQDLLQSSLPEYRGEVANQLGATLFRSGDTYFRPNLNTSNLGMPGVDYLLKYLGPLLTRGRDEPRGKFE